MKIVVLGASGMAGHVVSSYLEEKGHKVSRLSARNKIVPATTLLDVTDRTSLISYLKSEVPDVIVNCIGMLVQKSETDKDIAVYLNAYLPHLLQSHYRGSSTKVIHLSTDCVFSGKLSPYYESTYPDGELFYDRTKALGEIHNDKDLTFRMSIIGPDASSDGIGLFNWFYAQKGTINGYKKSIWSGVTTIELAKAIDASIKQNLAGLYHLVPEKNISKHDLLCLFREVFLRDDLTITPVDGIDADKTLINTRTDFDYIVPDYKTMLLEMRDWILTHQVYYPHYLNKEALDE